MISSVCSNSDMLELAAAEIPIPLKVYKKADEIFEKCDNRYIRIEDIIEFNGKMVLRTFAARKLKKMVFVDLVEIGRKMEDERTIICNCDFHWMCGWCAKWKGEWNFMDCYLADNKRQADFGGYPVYDEKEIVEKFGKYCAWEKYKKDDSCMHMSLFKYLSIYRKKPQIEYLVKAGYSAMLPSHNLLNMKGKTFEEIFKCDKKWAEFLKRKNGNMLKVVRNKYIKTVEEAETVYEANSKTETSKFMKFAQAKHKYDMAKFVLSLNYGDRIDYFDYLETAKKIGVPLDQKKELIPENIVKMHERHDRVAAKAKKIKSEKVDKGIKEMAEKMTKFEFEEDDLIIRPCRCNEELIQESKELEHCVRNYAEKYSEGRTSIFFIRHKREEDKPFVTLELSDNKVIQVRGFKNNTKNPLEQEVKDFVKHWGTKFEFDYEVVA